MRRVRASLRQRIDLARIHGIEEQPAQPHERATAHAGAGHMVGLLPGGRHARRSRSGTGHQRRFEMRQRQSTATDGAHFIDPMQHTIIDGRRQQRAITAGDRDPREIARGHPARLQHAPHARLIGLPLGRQGPMPRRTAVAHDDVGVARAEVDRGDRMHRSVSHHRY